MGCSVRPDLLSREGMDTPILSLPQEATTRGRLHRWPWAESGGWALPWEGVAPGSGHSWPSRA